MTARARYAPVEISYPEIKALVSSNKVVRVALFGDRVHGVLNAPMALSVEVGPAWDFGTWIPGEGDASFHPARGTFGAGRQTANGESNIACNAPPPRCPG